MQVAKQWKVTKVKNNWRNSVAKGEKKDQIG